MSKIVSLLVCIGALSTATAQTDLLMEDFQSGIPANFSLVNNDGFTPNAQVAEYTDAWISKADPSDATNLTASSTSFFSPVGQADRWLITNALTLGAYGNYVSWQAKSHDPSFPDGYKILVSTTTDDIAAFTDTIASIQGEYEDWTTRTVNLSEEGFNGQTIYLAFVNRTNNGFKLYLDSIHVWKEDPVSVNEVNDYQLTIYPNPFQDQITISTDLNSTRIEILDMNGRVIYTAEEQTKISTADFLSGVYLLKIYSENQIITRRIIKN